MDSPKTTNNHSYSTPISIIQTSLGILVSMLGVFVLVGWHINNERLIQVLPAFVPMQYNTAFGFFVCGIGLICLLWARRAIFTISLIVFLLGLLTLSQYVFGFDLGIDELLMNAYITVKSSHPGRMAPNTALCFMLSGIAFFLQVKINKKEYWYFSVALIGALIMALGAVALVGYVTGVPRAYGWGQLTKMAVHTSLGFLFVGAGIVIQVWKESREKHFSSPYWLPSIAVFGALTITICLIQALYATEQHNIQNITQTEAGILKSSVEKELETRVLALERMAERWAVRKGTPREEWEIDAKRYIKDYGSYQAIEWVDDSFHVRWVVPPKGNAYTLDLNLASEPKRRVALENSRDKREATMTQSIELVQGGHGILVYAPIYNDAEFHGFIVGVVRIDNLFTSSLSSDFVNKYSYNLYDGGEKIFSYGEIPLDSESRVVVTDIEFSGVTFQARVIPNRETVNSLSSKTNEVVLFIGFMVSILLGMIVYLAQLERRRAKDAALLNVDLVSEIKERERIEKALIENNIFKKAILNAANYMIISTGVDGTIVAFNETAENCLGYKADEVIDKESPAILHDLDEIVQRAEELTEELGTKIEPGFEAFVAKARMGEADERVWTYIRKDGTRFPIKLSVTAVRGEDGELRGFLGVGNDITEELKIAAELKAAHDSALESSKIKSEFLANMSHEIRTPMNGIIGMTDILIDTELDSDQCDYAATIKSSADSLLNIINDILDFSKIEAGKLKFETIDFNLRRTIENTVQVFAEQASNKDIELVSSVSNDVKVALRGDPGRLRQVLVNLIGNAVKFTDVGEIIVRVDKEEETDDDVILRFSVKDTGIGISPQVRRDLFQAFTQADGSMTRKYGGTGLGLTISKQLVEMMNGEISVESSAGEGSTFFFTASFQKQDVEEPRKLELREDYEGLRVLIVDDNETNRRVLVEQLTPLGIYTEEARHGKEALEILRNSKESGNEFELALLDLMMPEMDGFELAERIRADEKISDIHLVLMPSYGKRGHAEVAKKAGVDGYLIKPVRQADLYDCIAAVTTKPENNSNKETPMEKQLITKHVISENREKRNETILLVEDNIVNQKLIRIQLQRLGFQSDLSVNGIQALEALKKNDYSLILMDCQMPLMDGYAASSEIRRIEDDTHIPIIAITANAMEGEREKCLAAGMDEFLTKPFKQEQLAKLIYKFLDKYVPKSDTINEAKTNGSASVNGLDKLQRNNTMKQLKARLAELEDEVGAEIIADIISLFVEDSQSRVKVLKKLAEEGTNFLQIKREAHGLKGSSANVGAETIRELCANLELEAETENPAGVLSVTNEIESSFPILLETLEQIKKEYEAELVFA